MSDQRHSIVARRCVEDGLRFVQVGQGVCIGPSRVEQEAALVGVQAVADRPGPGHREYRIEPACLGGLQVRSLVGQQADCRYGEQEQPERRDRQREVQPPPEACRDEGLQARQSRDHGEAGKCHPEPA